MKSSTGLKKYTINHPAVTAFVANLIGLGQQQTEIHEMLVDAFTEPLEAAQMDDIIDRAHAYMIEQLNRPVDVMRAEAVAFYQGIIRTAEKDGDRIKARQRIDDLTGLERRIENEGQAAELAKIAREAWDSIDTLIDEPESEFADVD